MITILKLTALIVQCFRVDRESVAEQAGLQVGDLILDVNGTSFESIPHQEAVDFVKSQEHIIMTVKVHMTAVSGISKYMRSTKHYHAANGDQSALQCLLKHVNYF
jgi:predicted metalloprotease with PDZ domain